MRTSRFLPIAALVALVTPVLVSPAVARTGPTTPVLTSIRAAHHPGFDRVVFTFHGGLPTARAQYVDQLVGDASGKPVRIAGRAILRVRFEPAAAHVDGTATARARRAFALPNVMTTVQAGDFEAVTSYGIGLAKRTSFHVSRLRSPARVVVDVRAAFATRQHPVFFLDRDRFLRNDPPFFVPRSRPVRPGTPATGLMDRLFAGPTVSEQGSGLQLVRSGATGFSHLSVSDGVARVRLEGRCSSGGSTVTIAGAIMPTLRALASVRWVKIFDPAGSTEHPTGHRDSIPACLEP